MVFSLNRLLQKFQILFLFFLPCQIAVGQTSQLTGQTSSQELSASLTLQSGHSGAVEAFVYSSDGQFVVTAGNDSNVILWNRKTGRKIRAFQGHKFGVA